MSLRHKSNRLDAVRLALQWVVAPGLTARLANLTAASLLTTDTDGSPMKLSQASRYRSVVSAGAASEDAGSATRNLTPFECSLALPVRGSNARSA